jgi:hypothetical protein
MRLRRGLRVLRTGDDEVQIGTDPRWSVRLHGLTATQCRAVLRGTERTLRPALPEPVLIELDRLGLLRAPVLRTTPMPDRLVPDVLATALVGDGDLREVRERRAAATVTVGGLGRTGILIATTLAGAGVGTVLLDDRRRVLDADVGTGLSPADVGHRRQTAAAQLLRTVAPGVRTGSTDRWGNAPAVVVTVSADAADPEQGLRLMSTGLPWLPVVLREADALIGPLSVPGGPSCQRCVELARADRDPQWPRVLGLLCSGDRVAAEPVVLAAVAGGLAAAEVLRVVDGGRPMTAGRQYEVPMPSVEPRLRAWAAHPECGCAALPTSDGKIAD